MSDKEKVLIEIIKAIGQANRNALAVALQSYIAEEGPLSEEAAAEVRKLLDQ